MMRAPTLVTVSMLLGSVAFAQEPFPSDLPESVGLSSAHLDSIGHVVGSAVAEGRIAGAVVGVVRAERVVYLEAHGVQDLETDAPMTPASVFRIYSMTKAVTAVAAAILMDEGQLTMDDRVAAYLPEFSEVMVVMEDGSTRPPTRPVTVRDLFLHTAGLSHRSSPEYREASVRSRSIDLSQFIRNITAVPLRDDPGARFRYSASPTVLGRVVEVVSGASLDDFMADRIFEPLGMVDTGFQVRGDQLARLTTVYRLEDGLPLQRHEIEDVPFTSRPELLEGAVGLVATVPDFLRFAQMLVNGGTLDGVRILAEETTRMLTTNGLPEALLPIYGEGLGWGAASVSVVVDADIAGGEVFQGEYRWDGSAGTEFWVEPTTGTILVTAWQSSPANPDRLRQRIRRLVRAAIRG